MDMKNELGDLYKRISELTGSAVIVITREGVDIIIGPDFNDPKKIDELIRAGQGALATIRKTTPDFRIEI